MIRLLILLTLTGCASSRSFTTGDCIEWYTMYRYGKQVAIKPDGEPLYDIQFIKEDKRKVTCPKETK